MRMDQARLRAEMEESGNSSTLSANKATGKAQQEEESAYSDSFDDVSVSGSSKRLDGNWPGKTKSRPKVEDS